MASTSFAYSAGSPSRDGNGTAAASSSLMCGGSPSIIGVLKRPGAMVTQRTPVRARSRAMGSVMPATAALDAAYATWPTCPSNAAMDAVLTRTPRRPSAPGSFEAMAAAARRQTLNVPTTLTFNTSAKSSSLCGPFLPRTRAGGAMPAHDTATSRRPNAVRAASIAAWTSASSLTSPLAKIAEEPSSLATASPASDMSKMHALPPCLRKRSTVARPRPRAPPVTRATRFIVLGRI
mmetsp:Transcript_14182/g.42610  ORF Transcript_14182/g.42610 Transcript_14182/m.42610 type:complete len:235 (-) Transcript_14182:93-797(-)